MAIKRPTLPKLHRPAKADFKSFKFFISLSVVSTVIMLAGAGYVWYTNILTDSDRVFYGMLNKNLKTDSVTRSVSQNEAQRTVSQTYYLSYRPTPLAESTTSIEQIDQNRQKSSVTTRSIGTKDADFVQYSAISIPEASGKNSVKDVLNQWAKRENKSESGETTQFLSEALFMFVPFGNINPQDREKLLESMKENETYSIKSHTMKLNGLRPTMTYGVSIKPKALVKVLSEYVKETGIGDASQLNPADYESAGDVQVNIVVDVFSRHLKEMTFAGDSRKEIYSGYGVRRHTELPTKTITMDELQTRLQAIQ